MIQLARTPARVGSTLGVLIFLAACSMSSSLTQYAPAVDTNFVAQHDVTITPLHNFGRGKDGYAPEAGLLYYNHRLYGTTQYGGVGGNGTVFELRSFGSEHMLYSFGRQPDGAEPVASLVQLSGKLYGTTKVGGRYKMGTVFSITPAGKEQVIYSFEGGPDGANPTASLTVLRGVLYGTTHNGGINGEGTVFSLKLGRHPEEHVLHSFGNSNDGAYPAGALVSVKNEFYGTTTEGGGASGASYGSVFRILPGGSEHVVYPFDCTNGAAPVSALIVVDGTFFGTTSQGGAACPSAGDGTVFTLSSGSQEHVVHGFTGGPSDGSDPLAALFAWNGRLFGTTWGGGQYSGGTFFSLTPAGDEKVLHSFGNGTDGNHPAGSVVRVGKAYYGTTAGGGRFAGGIVFKLTL